MKYKNLNAELARKGMTKENLRDKLEEKGCKISYSKLCRQLRGESEIPFGQAGLMSQILSCDVEYLMQEEIEVI